MSFDQLCDRHKLRPIDRKSIKPSFDRISEHMGWGEEKTSIWFETENPLLGGVAPSYFLVTGRIPKLLKFINNLIEENYL